jgi:hypothetical protein
MMSERGMREKGETRHTANAITTTDIPPPPRSQSTMIVSLQMRRKTGTHAARARKAATISSSVGSNCAMGNEEDRWPVVVKY